MDRYLTQNQQRSTPVGWPPDRAQRVTNGHQKRWRILLSTAWLMPQTAEGPAPPLRDRDGWDLMVSGGASRLTAARTLSGPPGRPAGDVVNAGPRRASASRPYHRAERE